MNKPKKRGRPKLCASQKKGYYLGLRIQKKDADLIKEAAKIAGVPFSEIVRRGAMIAARNEFAKKWVSERHPQMAHWYREST
jgi:uncharacterized protein (DUF1778 family)